LKIKISEKIEIITMKLIDFFVYYIFAPIVLAIGLTGNSLGLAVFMKSSKELNKNGPILIYKFLFLSDTFYLLQIIIDYFGHGFDLDLTVLSNLSCQIYIYFNYAFCALSPWLLVYILIERFISIGHPTKRLIMRKKSNQIIYLFILVLFNLCSYIIAPFSYKVQNYNINNNNNNNNNESNISYLNCNFINYERQLIISYFDLFYRALLPFILMIFISFLLIVIILFVINFKTQIKDLNTDKVKRRIKRDIRFAFSSFGMNLLFIILNLPLSLVLFLPDYYISNTLFLATFYLYYLSYGINFFVIFAVNKIFRKSVKKLFFKKKVTNRIQDIELRVR
jgi:hypothetical protein